MFYTKQKAAGCANTQTAQQNNCKLNSNSSTQPLEEQSTCSSGESKSRNEVLQKLVQSASLGVFFAEAQSYFDEKGNKDKPFHFVKFVSKPVKNQLGPDFFSTLLKAETQNAEVVVKKIANSPTLQMKLGIKIVQDEINLVNRRDSHGRGF